LSTSRNIEQGKRAEKACQAGATRKYVQIKRSECPKKKPAKMSAQARQTIKMTMRERVLLEMGSEKQENREKKCTGDLQQHQRSNRDGQM
jgi:hypothetical protein